MHRNVMYCNVSMEGRLRKLCDVLCECDDADFTWFDNGFGGLVCKAGVDPNRQTCKTTDFPEVFESVLGVRGQAGSDPNTRSLNSTEKPKKANPTFIKLLKTLKENRGVGTWGAPKVLNH